MSQAFTLRPIGTVSSTRDTPIDDDWNAIPAHIDLDPEQFDEEALMGPPGPCTEGKSVGVIPRKLRCRDVREDWKQARTEVNAHARSCSRTP